MKDETKETQVAWQRDDKCNHAQNHRIDELRKMNPDPERNWAWTTSGSRYDWMDSHAPFAYLD
jgi:hypothetical protein